MAPIRKGDGTTLTPKGIAEVRKGDGTVLYSAGSDVPDPVIHHYDPDNFTSSNWPDEIGSSDIDSINGLSVDDTAFADSGGISGDGTSYGTSDTMGGFGSNMDSDFAIAFAFNTTQSDGEFCGVLNGNTGTGLECGTRGTFGSNGPVKIFIRDDNGDSISAETSQDLSDGGNYVLVINKTGNDATDIEMYTTPTNNQALVTNNDGVSEFSDFDEDMHYFSRYSGGESTWEIDAVMDNFYWFDSALTQSERETVFNSYEWWSD